jgi:hypothetical protein
MGNLIRATALRGYRDVVRELGRDPDPFLARCGIPAGTGVEEDAFVPSPRASRVADEPVSLLRSRPA